MPVDQNRPLFILLRPVRFYSLHSHYANSNKIPHEDKCGMINQDTSINDHFSNHGDYPLQKPIT